MSRWTEPTPTTTCVKCRFACVGEWLPSCTCREAKEEANAARIEVVRCSDCGVELASDAPGCTAGRAAA